jgi:hypothetical protein
VILKAGIKKTTCKDWLIFPENIGKRSMTKPPANGELYTILTNKAAKGKKDLYSNDCWH